MTLIEKGREPTAGELRFFGILLAAFGILMGGLILYFTDSWTIAIAIWSVGLLLGTFYYTLSSAQHIMYHAWMAMFYPIGWLISHMLMAMIFYLAITPISLVMRLCGRDPLLRKLDRSTKTYWTPNNTREEAKRYFQQF